MEQINVKRAASILDVHPETVRRYIREGKLSASQFNNSYVLDYEAVVKFKKEHNTSRGRQPKVAK